MQCKALEYSECGKRHNTNPARIPEDLTVIAAREHVQPASPAVGCRDTYESDGTMAKSKPGADPEDDEFVDRLIDALAREDLAEARRLGDQLEEVVGDLDANPATLVERTSGDPGASIAAQAHLSEWILILESREEFEAAAEIELALIDLFRRDLAEMWDQQSQQSSGYREDAEAIIDQYEVRAIRFLFHLEDPARATEAMQACVHAAAELKVPLDADQQELAAELGVS